MEVLLSNQSRRAEPPFTRACRLNHSLPLNDRLCSSSLTVTACLKSPALIVSESDSLRLSRIPQNISCKRRHPLPPPQQSQTQRSPPSQIAQRWAQSGSPGVGDPGYRRWFCIVLANPIFRLRQSARGSAAARANSHMRMRSASTRLYSPCDELARTHRHMGPFFWEPDAGTETGQDGLPAQRKNRGEIWREEQ
jgi:hypothetical protein